MPLGLKSFADSYNFSTGYHTFSFSLTPLCTVACTSTLLTLCFFLISIVIILLHCPTLLLSTTAHALCFTSGLVVSLLLLVGLRGWAWGLVGLGALVLLITFWVMVLVIPSWMLQKVCS